MSELKSGLSVSKYFGQRLIELIELPTGVRVLDVGFGLGSSLFPAAEIVGSQGRVIGIDIDEERVQKTVAAIAEREIKNAQVFQMDVLEMSLEDDFFDFMLGGFVVPYLFKPDTQVIAPEITRVLKRGGRIGFTTWDYIEDDDWMIAALKEELGSEIKGRNLSIYTSYPVQELEVSFSEAGFADVMHLREVAEFVYPDMEKWWAAMQYQSWISCYKDIEARGPGELERFKEATYQKLLGPEADELRFKVSVDFFFGTYQE